MSLVPLLVNMSPTEEIRYIPLVVVIVRCLSPSLPDRVWGGGLTNGLLVQSAVWFDAATMGPDRIIKK